jgi:hypothetical protein
VPWPLKLQYKCTATWDRPLGTVSVSAAEFLGGEAIPGSQGCPFGPHRVGELGSVAIRANRSRSTDWRMGIIPC